ncbi:hypothetical protein GGR55DRAFT_217842 [Xylaria sp. FL0064]|nr:hypothetical protein GGR55DRAFT_217842 [Xylaria sp. FL0064]
MRHMVDKQGALYVALLSLLSTPSTAFQKDPDIENFILTTYSHISHSTLHRTKNTKLLVLASARFIARICSSLFLHFSLPLSTLHYSYSYFASTRVNC